MSFTTASKKCMMMAMAYHLHRVGRKVTLKDGTEREYESWAIRKSEYLKDVQASKTIYLFSIGTKPVVGEETLRDLGELYGEPYEEVSATPGLKVVSEDQYKTPPRKRTRKKTTTVKGR